MHKSEAHNPPFIIYALPRSRTAWLSVFLSYQDWTCYHEQAVYMRSMDDVKKVLSMQNTGVAETGVAAGWRLIKHHAPDIKQVVILRPVEDVIAAMLKIDVSDVATYDPALLRRNMEYTDRALREIAKQPGVLVVDYADLGKADVCARIFEFCLPYKFDRAWWKSLKDENIQTDIRQSLLYYFANSEAIAAFKRHCKSELRRLCKIGAIPFNRGGFTWHQQQQQQQ